MSISYETEEQGATPMQHPFPREARQVLAELELISHGQTQAFNPSGRSTERDPRPFGESSPPHLLFRERFERAGEGEWPAIVEEARAVLAGLRCQRERPRGESQADIDARAVMETEDWTAEECAFRYGMTPRRLRKVRALAGRDAETSRPLSVSPSERSDIALKLSRAGWSQERIAQVLRVSQPTVSRLLRVARVAA